MGDDDDDQNRPSMPSLAEADLRTVVEEEIHRAADNERMIDRLDRRTQALVAGTSKWQREIGDRLERIEGCLQLLTNKVLVMQWMKVSLPYAVAFGVGGFIAVLVYLVAHR